MTSKHPYSKQDEEALKILRSVINASGNKLLSSKYAEMTDEHLVMFLRCRNYDVPSSFDKIQRMMIAKKEKYPEVFKTFYPSALYKIFETHAGGILKNRDAKGRHILFLQHSHMDPDKLGVDDMIRSAMMIGFEALLHKDTQVNGVILIANVGGFGLKDVKHVNPMRIKKYVDILLNANPLKFKAAHILNAPMLFNMTLSVAKVLLPQKLHKRIYAHGSSMKSLHKWISPDILPDFFGGNLSENEAVDHKIVDDLYTQEKEDYYKSFITEEDFSERGLMSII